MHFRYCLSNTFFTTLPYIIIIIIISGYWIICNTVFLNICPL